MWPNCLAQTGFLVQLNSGTVHTCMMFISGRCKKNQVAYFFEVNPKSTGVREVC
jgi:hypothetical protein